MRSLGISRPLVLRDRGRGAGQHGGDDRLLRQDCRRLRRLPLGFPDELFARLRALRVGLPAQQVVDLGTGTGTPVCYSSSENRSQADWRVLPKDSPMRAQLTPHSLRAVT